MPFGRPTGPERAPAGAPLPAPFTVAFVCGRMRFARHLLVAAVGCCGAWAWFGGAGLVPTLLWAWHCSPRPGAAIRHTIGPVVRTQLGAYRTLAWSRGERLEIFHDELPPEALASLRRELKVACSAGHGAEHVEPV